MFASSSYEQWRQSNLQHRHAGLERFRRFYYCAAPIVSLPVMRGRRHAEFSLSHVRRDQPENRQSDTSQQKSKADAERLEF